MAFSLTYSNILGSSLKNIYSGDPATGTITRSVSRDNPPVSKEDQCISPSERFQIRQSQYWSRWNSPLPRAPAYRSLPQSDVSRIVDRLATPINREAGNKSTTASTPRTKQSKTSRKFERLTVTSQLPTVSSVIRQKIREGYRSGNPPDIRHSCDRFGTKVSQRYARPRYSLSLESDQPTSPR